MVGRGREEIDVCGDDPGHVEIDYHLPEEADGGAYYRGVQFLKEFGK